MSWPTRPEEVRRGRQVHAEVDAAQLVDPVEPLDPDGGFLVELLRLVLLAEQIALLLVRLVLADAVGVMRLVVQDQDVLLAADLPAENRG